MKRAPQKSQVDKVKCREVFWAQQSGIISEHCSLVRTLTQ